MDGNDGRVNCSATSEGRGEACARIKANSTQHASLGDDEANQAGSFSISAMLALSPGDQLEMLNGLGYPVENRDRAIGALEDAGFFRLASYCWHCGCDASRPFDYAVDAHELDRGLREWLWVALAPIELKFRSRFVNELTALEGPFAYLDASLFRNHEAHERSLSIIRADVRRAQEKRAVRADSNPGEKPVPFCLVAETTSWGVLSRLYGNLRRENGNSSTVFARVSAAFGVKPFLMKSWMEHLTFVRNVCAHHGRLYGKDMKVAPRLLSVDKSYFSLRLFPTILVLKRIYERSWPERWPVLVHQLDRIVSSAPRVDMAPLGFPQNWRTVIGLSEEMPQVVDGS